MPGASSPLAISCSNMEYTKEDLPERLPPVARPCPSGSTPTSALVATLCPILKPASSNGCDGGGAGTSCQTARSNKPDPSPSCSGAMSPASSPAGNGKVCFWIAGQTDSMGCHDCSPANNGSWIGSEMEKATFNNGSCIRLSTTSLGIDLQASQSRIPKAEATQIVMPAITNMETPKGLNQPANKIPPLIPAMIMPRNKPARRKSNCKPQEFGVSLPTPPSVPYE